MLFILEKEKKLWLDTYPSLLGSWGQNAGSRSHDSVLGVKAMFEGSTVAAWQYFGLNFNLLTNNLSINHWGTTAPWYILFVT